ncbi:methionine aminopeptidase [Leucobacter allii]|uniref:Methionine aminopeptidase n=1 Tax=Leucobacter allii TaxID=2932247 RepID=A0ABY4FQU6_9MICO|nr:methionine aminopeptidase [Leucobacter allii]UOQ58632.1 methionine aminopeptidase [Leucobacter allii]
MSKRDWGIEDPAETYWFNTRTRAVEEGPQSLSVDRLGPFSSREEAARAEEIVAERARRWAEEDAVED